MRSLGAVLDFQNSCSLWHNRKSCRQMQLDSTSSALWILQQTVGLPAARKSPFWVTNKSLVKMCGSGSVVYGCSMAKGQVQTCGGELFSPPRFTTEAERQGLTGLSFDLKNGYNLLDRKPQREVEAQLDEVRPELFWCYVRSASTGEDGIVSMNTSSPLGEECGIVMWLNAKWNSA